MTVTFEPMDGPFGVVANGLDLRMGRPDVVDLVRGALARHLLVVARPQPPHKPPTDNEINRFFAPFGRLTSETPEAAAHYARVAANSPEFFGGEKDVRGKRLTLSNVETDGRKMGGLGNQDLEWHNDLTNLPGLKTISVLEAIDFEEGAGNTFFCDMYLASETLPGPVRIALSRLEAVHDTQKYDPGSPSDSAAPTSSTTHPVVQAHPTTGRCALYVNPSFTRRVIGLESVQSERLLEALYRLAYQPQFIVEHEWKTGDIAIWDNVGLQHMRHPPDPTKRRTMRVFQGVSHAWHLQPELLQFVG